MANTTIVPRRAPDHQYTINPRHASPLSNTWLRRIHHESSARAGIIYHNPWLLCIQGSFVSGGALIDSKPVSSACSPPARKRQADVAPWWALSRRQNFAIYAAVSHGVLGKKAVVHALHALLLYAVRTRRVRLFTFLECYLFAICSSDTCSAEPPRMTRAASCRAKRRGGDAVHASQP